MEKLKGLGAGRLAVMGGVLLAALLALAVWGASSALATNIGTLPDSAKKISTLSQLTLSTDNLTYEIHASRASTVPDGDQLRFAVRAKTSSTLWSYDNPVTLTFTGVGEIGGRSLDAVIDITKVVCTAPCAAGKDVTFCSVGAPGFWFDTRNNGDSFKPGTMIDYTCTVKYHDDGTTVDLPFIQRVQDLDQTWVVPEQWTAVDGWSKFYTYQSCALKITGTTFAADKSVDLLGDDSIIKGGVVAETVSGKFSGQFQEGGCGTGFELYSQYMVLDDPVKEQKVDSPWKPS